MALSLENESSMQFIAEQFGRKENVEYVFPWEHQSTYRKEKKLLQKIFTNQQLHQDAIQAIEMHSGDELESMLAGIFFAYSAFETVSSQLNKMYGSIHVTNPTDTHLLIGDIRRQHAAQGLEHMYPDGIIYSLGPRVNGILGFTEYSLGSYDKLQTKQDQMLDYSSLQFHDFLAHVTNPTMNAHHRMQRIMGNFTPESYQNIYIAERLSSHYALSRDRQVSENINADKIHVVQVHGKNLHEIANAYVENYKTVRLIQR